MAKRSNQADAPAVAPRWQFWIDVGGTFTDCLARDPSGRLFRDKRLSSGTTKGCVAEGSTREQVRDPGPRSVDELHLSKRVVFPAHVQKERNKEIADRDQ